MVPKRIAVINFVASGYRWLLCPTRIYASCRNLVLYSVFESKICKIRLNIAERTEGPRRFLLCIVNGL